MNEFGQIFSSDLTTLEITRISYKSNKLVYLFKLGRRLAIDQIYGGWKFQDFDLFNKFSLKSCIDVAF